MSVTAPSATSKGGGRWPRLPAFVLAMVTFTAMVVAGNLLVMRLVAPALLRNADLTHLKPTLVQIVLLAYASTFLAALIAGVAAGLRGLQRGSVSRGGNIISALFGTLLVAGAVITYALLARLPLPGRPTEINLGLIALGAVLGALLIDVRGRPAGAARRLGRPGPPSAGTVMAGISMLANLMGLPSNLTAPNWAGGHPASIPAESAGSTDNPLDIEAANCDLLSRALAVDVDLTVLSISLGPHFAYAEIEHPGGTWDTVATSGLKGGLKLVLGQHVAANLLKGTSLREGLSFELDADGLLTAIDTYNLKNATEANNQVIQDALTYLDNDVILPVAAELIQPALTTAITSTAPRIPKDEALELAGNLKLSVQGGAGVGAEVSVQVGSKSGLKFVGDGHTQPLTNPQEVDLYVGLNGEAEGAVTLVLAQANGKGASDLVLTMAIAPSNDLAKVWAPSKISLEAAGEISAGVGLAFSNADTAASGLPSGASSLSWFKQLSGSSSSGVRLEMASGLKFAGTGGHPEDLVTFLEFFAALGPVLAGQPTTSQQAALQTAAQNFATALAKDAAVQASVFKTAGANASIDIAAGFVITFGASAEAELSNENLVGAAFLDQGRRWTNSETCQASARS